MFYQPLQRTVKGFKSVQTTAALSIVALNFNRKTCEKLWHFANNVAFCRSSCQEGEFSKDLT